MQELTQNELLMKKEQASASFAVLLYTPFCGTCKVASRMLDILLQMDPELALYQSNINFLPTVSQAWQITSVPCIIIIEDQQIQNKIYQMQSIEHLYKLLQPLK